MKLPSRRAKASLVVSVVLLLALLIPVADQFLFRYEWARATLEDIERRHARLLGLRDAGPDIAAALNKAKADLVRYAYPVDQSADRVGADLQQRVRQIAERAGVTVAGSQILAVRSGDGIEVVPLGLTLEADMGGLRDFLSGLVAENPSIQLESLAITMQRQRGPQAEGKVRVQLQLNAIHLTS